MNFGRFFEETAFGRSVSDSPISLHFFRREEGISAAVVDVAPHFYGCGRWLRLVSRSVLLRFPGENAPGSSAKHLAMLC